MYREIFSFQKTIQYSYRNFFSKKEMEIFNCDESIMFTINSICQLKRTKELDKLHHYITKYNSK